MNGTVAAVIPACNEEQTIAATVRAVAGCGVSTITVVDDGSSDATAQRAADAGAVVVRIKRRSGKGAALMVGLNHIGNPDMVLFIDGDVGDSAGEAGKLIWAVNEGADMVIGVLPSGQSGGFGVVQAAARLGTVWLGGSRLRAPLSGQRAIRWQLTRELLPLAAGFGVEVAMNVRAAKAGAVIVEVPIAMEHRRTGRDMRGMLHRAGQLRDVVWTLGREWYQGRGK